VHVRGSLEDAEELPVLQHTFSHYRLHLQILARRVEGLRADDPAMRWVADHELPALGLPAPIRKLLESGSIPPAPAARRKLRAAAPLKNIE